MADYCHLIGKTKSICPVCYSVIKAYIVTSEVKVVDSDGFYFVHREKAEAIG